MAECSCDMVQQIVGEAVNEIRGMLESLRATLETQQMSAKRSKRAPSEYNLFIGECMKGGGSMKDCALRYKSQKHVNG